MYRAMPKEKNDEDPVRTSLGESYSEEGVGCSSVCDTSQEDSGIQDGEKSGECTEATSTSIMLDFTGEPSTDEGNESLVESSMPEGVELDTEGEELVAEEEKPIGPPAVLDVVPSYDSDCSGVLTDVEFSMLTGKKINEARPKQSCFNCSGDHNMAQCTLPLDHSKISANRKKRMSSRMSVRYHEDCENKYGQYQPGKISDNLRHALGLRPNQLPLYIYRMRVLGYPPGWLKEAEVHQADVKMYDATGRTVSHPDEEEGEAEPLTVKYKPEKLVRFPGFNDNAPRGIIDESQKYNFPPMQPCHQMSEFLHFMNQNKAEAYKKKKLKDSELRSKTPPLSIEMEVEECEGKAEDIVFNPPLPEEDPPPPPPPDTKESPSIKRVLEVEDGEITDDSQESMESLTVKKQRILKELEKETTQSDTKGDIDNSDGNRESQEDSEDSQLSLTSSTDPSQSENSCSGDGTSTKKTKTKRHHRSLSKGFQLGTVIPESCTPYKSLPSPDKWTVDVSDHIVFDNLPDALGTWDKMKGVMGTVRKKMTILHADEDD
ncbi:hypothetical protein O3P69_017341 [Scylla paramamosain]|uniref:PSP proline-rich domain-containing protein n=1 Tax=Scylla paramamosain TaxID=85552 RepID=A0AAW0TW74_SCYPA